VTAIAFGALGTFFSSLLRRSGAATGLTFVAVLVTTVGLSFIWIFMMVTSNSNGFVTRRPPEALFYLNPFVAQVDVACGAEGTSGGWCSVIDTITGTQTDFIQPQPGGVIIDGKGGAIAVPAGPNFGPGIVAPGIQPDVAPGLVGIQRDRYWPRSALALLLLAVGFTAAAVQLVSPTRRWQPRLPGIRRRAGPPEPRPEPASSPDREPPQSSPEAAAEPSGETGAEP